MLSVKKIQSMALSLLTSWRMNLMILAVGFILIAILSFGFYKGLRLNQIYVPLVDATMEIRFEATLAYLWYEEILSGDSSTSVDLVRRHFGLAEWYAHAMLEGGKNPHGVFIAVTDQQFRLAIESVQDKLTELREILEWRLASLNHTGSGASFDRASHEKFSEFINQTQDIESSLKRVIADGMRAFKIIQIMLIVSCIFLVLTVFIAFNRFERRREQDFQNIKSAKEHLEKEIANRKILERQIIQSEKLAALGRMVAGIAHEINNPNNFINFNIPILKEYIQEIIPIIDDYAKGQADWVILNMPYPEFRRDFRKLIDNIENGSRRINRIVSDLKDFSRKKDNVRQDWVDIREVIESTLTICGGKLRKMVDSLEISIPEHLPKIYTDPEIVELILINLLINAAEATEKENGRVKLSASLDALKDGLRIEVSDNGCGMDEQTIKRIFDPFFTTKPSKEGSGLGLYLCLSLADRINIAIDVKSAQGAGSIFELTIPRVK
ncbi:MAG: hypothetical protein C4519_10890 [Desulfobacteraceae bacterium]|nr:MAG: hypothetical protein C4519_10890 [Desulfobacteraceae bacterium]